MGWAVVRRLFSATSSTTPYMSEQLCKRPAQRALDMFQSLEWPQEAISISTVHGPTHKLWCKSIYSSASHTTLICHRGTQEPPGICGPALSEAAKACLNSLQPSREDEHLPLLAIVVDKDNEVVIPHRRESHHQLAPFSSIPDSRLGMEG